LSIQTALEEKADLICTSEPNKGKCKERAWFADEDGDAAISVRNHRMGISGKGKGRGFVWVKMGGNVVYACYLSPNVPEERVDQFLEDLRHDIRRNGGRNIVLTGNFNGRSGVWGDRVEDRRGEKILEWVALCGLVIQNAGNEPTCIRPNGNSVVDMTFTTGDIANKLEEWRVLEEATLSDHKAIAFDIKEEEEEPRMEAEERWRFKGRKEEQMLDKVGEEEEWLKAQDADRVVERIRGICREIAPGVRRQNDRKEVYWWNGQIAEMRKECVKRRRDWSRKKARSNMKEQETIAARERYKEGRRALKKMIAKEKRKKWKELIDELEEDPWGGAYTIVVKRIRLAGAEKLDKEVEENVTRQLFPQQEPVRWGQYTNDGMTQVTKEELQEVIGKMKMGKAPGPDGLTTEIWKAIMKRYPEILVNMYNKLLAEGRFPDPWKEAKLVLLRKPGKEGMQPECFRPICLLDTAEGATMVVYADDVCLMCVAKEEEELKRMVDESLAEVGRWMQGAGLELALQKSEAILVKGRRVWQGSQFRAANMAIEIKNEAKYLGVWLDGSLCYRRHILEAGKKAEKITNALVKLMPNVGGPGMAKRRTIATAAQSAMLYGAEVWAPALEHESYRKILGSVQRRLLLRVVAAYRTVAEEVVQVLAGVPPVDLLAKERRSRYIQVTKIIYLAFTCL
ncbi:hypothetical protein NQ315_005918, partial [Exocentrus adspersus]